MLNSRAGDDGTGFKLYRYDPSVVLPAIASGLFGIVAIFHIWQMYRSRVWFLTPLIIGGFFEAIGYAGRAYSATQTPYWTIGPYIIQAVLPLVAPALFAGSIYMILGRIILMTDGESHSLIRRKWLTKIFVCGDVLAFTIQAGGAGLMSSGSMMKTGEYIVIAGLFVQIVFFGFFITLAFLFHYRMRKVPTLTVSSSFLPWQRHLFALYASSALILVRSVFRVVEFAQGNDGYLFSHEWFLWVFDALLMLIVMILFNCIHPGEIRGYLDQAKHSDLENQDSVGDQYRLQSIRVRSQD